MFIDLQSRVKLSGGRHQGGSAFQAWRKAHIYAKSIERARDRGKGGRRKKAEKRKRMREGRRETETDRKNVVQCGRGTGV